MKKEIKKAIAVAGFILLAGAACILWGAGYDILAALSGWGAMAFIPLYETKHKTI